MTPFALYFGVNAIVALYPPLNLNAPVFWKFSHLKNTSAPSSLFKILEVITGVTCAAPFNLFAAAKTSLYVGTYPTYGFPVPIGVYLVFDAFLIC